MTNLSGAVVSGRNSGEMTLEERFWEKVDGGSPDECWLWDGAMGQQGYGRIHNNDGDRLTHRVSYRLEKGDIPEGALILHKCDVKRCVNPNHLYAGDKEDNAEDARERGQMANGEDNGQAKLTEDDVIEIRSRSSNGESNASLGREFGVNRSAISMIVSGKRWSHVPHPGNRESGKDTDDEGGE